MALKPFRCIVMRLKLIVAAGLLMLHGPVVMAVDLDKLPKLGDMTGKPLLDNVNKSLADQQIKDGQFEFKTGKAEFAADTKDCQISARTPRAGLRRRYSGSSSGRSILR